MSVFIFEDPYPEETESLSFHIRSPNTSEVRIMEGRGQNNVFIRDNDGVCFHPYVLRTKLCRHVYTSWCKITVGLIQDGNVIIRACCGNNKVIV